MDISVNNVMGNPFAEMVCDNQKNDREPFQIQMENKESIEKVEEVSEGEVLGIGYWLSKGFRQRYFLWHGSKICRRIYKRPSHCSSSAS